ncbi:LADA_0F11166g1_1 [Lachancea dasiensis]|uniref:LADA_0F11166g1_1 n=1 Tax=Lachancea dasiensis TaxID=1072105 RepID=A0A1G4JLZ5_9SACH|nr:LADA_0F11166g1_1 [Lachancea dasiensis]
MSDAVISYATLILADAGLDITADSLTTLAKSAGASVDSIWAETFATALEGKDLKEILSGFHAAGSGAAGAAGAASGAAAGEAAAEEEAPEEEAEESDDDMGFGLFD